MQLSKFLFLKGSGYRSVNGPSYLKSYSSVTCNMKVRQDECVVECTTTVNLNKGLESFEESEKVVP